MSGAPFQVGDRIQLDRMDDPYDPVPAGTTGTVTKCFPFRYRDQEGWQVEVKWDIDRSLNVVMPPDKAHKLER